MRTLFCLVVSANYLLAAFLMLSDWLYGQFSSWGTLGVAVIGCISLSTHFLIAAFEAATLHSKARQ